MRDLATQFGLRRARGGLRASRKKTGGIFLPPVFFFERCIAQTAPATGIMKKPIQLYARQPNACAANVYWT